MNKLQRDCFLLAIALTCLTQLASYPWAAALLKVEIIRYCYLLGFSLIFSLGIVFVVKRFDKTYPLAAGRGAVLGFVASIFSLELAKLMEAGPARTLKAFDNIGLVAILSVDFVVAFLLGGWFVGILINVTLFRWQRQSKR